MKNLKKVLALVIVFAMMMSTAAFAGTAFPDVADDATYASAVATLSQLGFFTGDDKGNFNPDATITRAEYAVIMTRIAGITAAGTADFTDVPATHWATGYVNAASQNGLIKGYGDGNFGPEDPVKYEEAVTMLVRALGYEPLAVSKGGYPAGYLSVASQYGLLAGVSGTTGAGAPRSTVAVMTYNALDIPVVEQTGFGTDVQYTIMKQTDDQDKVTLLTRLNIYKLGGVVASNAKVAYNNASVQEKGFVQVKVNDDYDNPVKALRLTDNKNGKITVGAPVTLRDEANITEAYLASNVVTYVKEYASNKYDVVAIEPEDGITDTIVMNASDIDGDTSEFATKDDADIIKYYKDGSSKATSVKLDKDYSLVLNNQVLTGADKTTVYNELENETLSGVVELIDWDNNNKYDVVKITAYIHVIAKEVNTKNGFIETYNDNNENTKFSKIDLAVDDEDALVSVKDVNGNDVDYSTIEEYDVLALVVSPSPIVKPSVVVSKADGSNAYESLDVVVLGDSKVTGTVKGTSTVDGKTYYSIDSKKYEITGEEKTYYAENEIKNGSEGDFFIGIDGKIVGFAGSKAADGNYGFVVSAYAPSSSSTANITIITKEGTTKTYNYADKVKFTNPVNDNNKKVSMSATTDVAALNTVLAKTQWEGVFADSSVTPKKALLNKFNGDNVNFEGKEEEQSKLRLIKYNLNSDGEISEIIPAAKAASDTFDTVVIDKGEYKESTQKLNRKLIADDVVIFNVDWEDITTTTVKDLSFLVNENEYAAVAFDSNDDSEYGALVLTLADTTFAAGTPLAIVTSIEEGQDDEGNDIVTLDVVVEGEEKKVVIDEDTDEKYTTVGETNLEFGDIIMYNADANGVVDAFTVVGSTKYVKDSNGDYEKNFVFNSDFREKRLNVGKELGEDDAYFLAVYVKNEGKSLTLNVIDRISPYVLDAKGAPTNVQDEFDGFTGLSSADQYTFINTGKTKSVDIGSSTINISKQSEDVNYLVLVRTYEDSIQEIIAFDYAYDDDAIAKKTVANKAAENKEEVKAPVVEKEVKTPVEEVVAPVEEEVTTLTDVEIEL